MEVCCGTTCDKDKMEAEHKLLGAREFNRLLQATIVLTAAQKHILDTIETQYHVSLVKLKE